MNMNHIISQQRNLNILLQGEETVFKPRSFFVVNHYYRRCSDPPTTSLSPGDDYTVEIEYTDEQIREIITIANNCDKDSPVLWRALELGEIARRINADRNAIKNEIVIFILGKILPPNEPNSLINLYNLIKGVEISSEQIFLNILESLLRTAPKGEFIFLKAFYQLNKINKSDWEPSLVLQSLYPMLNRFLSNNDINKVAVKLQDVLYPRIPEGILPQEVTEEMHIAAFGLGNIEDIAPYLQYIAGEANFRSLINIVCNSLKKYVENPAESSSSMSSISPINWENITLNLGQEPNSFEVEPLINIFIDDIFTANSSSNTSNNVYNPLEPEKYKKLYKLRLVHYLFDGYIFNDVLDESLHNRKDLARYRDCYRTIYYSSLLSQAVDFYSAWNNLTS